MSPEGRAWPPCTRAPSPWTPRVLLSAVCPRLTCPGGTTERPPELLPSLPFNPFSLLLARKLELPKLAATATIAERWSSAQPLLRSTSVPTECVTAFASPCSAPRARLPRLPITGAPRRRRGRRCSICSRGQKATVHLRSRFHRPWVRVDELELEPPSSATAGPLRPTSATTGCLPCLASEVDEEGRFLFPLCLYECMTSGPG
jgi:hypothetical protein